MIKRCSELSKTSRKGSTSVAKHSPELEGEVFEQDMELDEEANENGWEDMDTEDTANAVKHDEMMQEVLLYGQLMTREYQQNREYEKALKECFSLIAYPDATQSAHGHLLDPAGRVNVAEELNSAILGMCTPCFL